MQPSVSPGTWSPEGPRFPGPCGLPGPRRAGSSVLLGLAPDGVCPDAPRHRDAGALLPHHFTFACARLTCGRAIGRVVSVALSRGFPRVGVIDRPCPVVSGLSSRDHLPATAWPAASMVGARSRISRRSAQVSSAPQDSQPPARTMEPPQTGHAARPSATSSSQTPTTSPRASPRPARTAVERCGASAAAAARRRGPRWSRRRHPQTLLNTPTTRPSTCASRVRIGL